MRPVDLARPHGLSSQAIRVYEERGILPPGVRTAGGHRRYGGRHRAALEAFLALVPGIGHADSAALVRLAHQGEVDAVLERLDRAHAQLARDRTTLDLVAGAVGGLGVPRVPDPGTALAIGALAHQLGIRPATVRAWEAAGILRPERDPGTGHRLFRAEAVRDAHLAHQLRRGGYLLRQISTVVVELRDSGSHDRLDQTLTDWRDALRRRGLALLSGTSALHELIARTDGPAPRS